MAGMALRRCSNGIRGLLCGAHSRSLPSYFLISNGMCGKYGSPSQAMVRNLSPSVHVPSGLLGINTISPVIPELVLTVPFRSAKHAAFRSMSSSSGSKSSSKGHSSKASGTSGQQQKSETRIAVILRSMQEKMKMEELPAAALGLGLAGALPFVILGPPFSSVLPLPDWFRKFCVDNLWKHKQLMAL